MCVGRLRPAHYWIDRQLLWHFVKVAEAMTSLVYTKGNLTCLAGPGCLCFWVVVLVALDSIHEATEKAAESAAINHWQRKVISGNKTDEEQVEAFLSDRLFFIDFLRVVCWCSLLFFL
jgi:hypothetical protein